MAARRKIWPAAPDPAVERQRETLHDHFCRHLVCLGIRYTDPPESPRADGRSRLAHGTFCVAETRGRWFLVTAGHVLQKLDAFVHQGKIVVEYYYLADCIPGGASVKKPIAFPYTAERRFFRYDAALGLDVGIIPLRDPFRHHLQTQGVLPLGEDQWQPGRDPVFFDYWMLGFPAEVNIAANEPLGAGAERKGVAASVIVSVEAIRDRNAIPEGVNVPLTALPLFVGRITADIPFGIKGMSGGPIFGLAELPTGGAGYKVVALQSTWDPRTRIIWGPSARLLGHILGGVASAATSAEPG